MPLKVRAAPAHMAAETAPCRRKLPISDLYHNVAVTAIPDRIQPVKNEDIPELREFGPVALSARCRPRRGPPRKFNMDASRGFNRNSF